MFNLNAILFKILSDFVKVNIIRSDENMSLYILITYAYYY